jgi:cytochrome c556
VEDSLSDAFSYLCLDSHPDGPDTMRSTMNFPVATTLMFLIAGCSGGNETPQTSNTATPSTPTPATENTQVANDNSPIRTDDKGQKWLGDVPFDVYDVFFDDPVAVISNDAAVMVAGNAGTSATGGTATPVAASGMGSGGAGSAPATEPTPVAAGATDWSTLITTDTIQNEVKSIRNELTRIMTSVGSYNRDFASVQILGSTLAGLAQIGHEHSGTLPWKQKAILLRDLAGKVSSGASGVGRDPYDKVLLPFEQIIVILDGGNPSNAPAPDEKASVASSADREWIMRRMQKSIDVLKTSNQNEPAFKGQKEQASAELQFLASMGMLLRAPDYVYADEKIYQDYMKTMSDIGVAARSATDAETFAAFQEQFNKMNQVCTDCHKQYRFE